MQKLICFLLMCCLCVAFSDSPFEITIEKQNSETTTFYVDLANTFDKRERGLMYVSSLPQDKGMLFIYDKESRVSMWMKNTFIPLDMIFIDKKGTITEIVERPDTRSRVTTISSKPIKYVLEINLGESTKRGIKVGDRVKIPQ